MKSSGEPAGLFPTAVSSSRVQRPNHTAAYHSIVDLNPRDIPSTPRFTEPATLRALENLGVTGSDLVPLSRHAISRIPGTDEIRGRIVAELDQRRLATIKSVTAERNRLLADPMAAPTQAPAEAEREATVSNPYGQLKRSQIESLIAGQTLRRRLTEAEKTVQERLEKERERRSAECELHKKEAVKRAQERIERAHRADAERGRVALLLLEQSQNEDERKAALRIEQSKRNEQARIEANQQREAKLATIRATQEKLADEEMRKAEQLMRTVQERQIAIAKKREEQIQALRNQQKMNEQQYQAKLERVSQREKEEQKTKEEAVRKRMEEAEIKVVQARREKNATLSERRQKEMARAEVVKNRRSRMGTDENRLAREMKERLEKVEERAQALKQMRELQLQEKAAQDFLKLKLTEERIAREERLKHLEQVRNAEATDRRAREIIEKKQGQKPLQAQLARETLCQELKEREELEQLRIFVEKHPDVDPAVAARQFNVSLS
jgi:hypothetical protein